MAGSESFDSIYFRISGSAKLSLFNGHYIRPCQAQIRGGQEIRPSQAQLRNWIDYHQAQVRYGQNIRPSQGRSTGSAGHHA